jgi:phage terminase large subunit
MLPLWRSDKRYRIAKGGRGSGKSYGIAQRFMSYALKGPCRLLCTRDVQNTLSDSALAILKRVIKDNGLDGAFEQTKHGLSCRNGSEFIFRGLQVPDRIKSLEGVRYVWAEEGQKITQDAWDILTPTIREPDSEIWVSYNPDTADDPVLKIERRPDAEVVRVNYYDNPYFPDVLRKEMQYDKETDYDKYLWVWEGNPRVVTDAQVFKGKFRVATFETPADARLYYGADWGFSQDPTVLVRCFIHNQILWIDYEAYGVGVDIDEIGDLFTSVPGAEKWPIAGDSERPDTMSYLRKQGFTVHGAKKGRGSVEEGVQFIRSFRGVVIHERCRHTADEFKLYSYKADRLTGDVLPVLEDKHNHCIDALRYALEKTMRTTKVAHMGAA